MRNLVGMKFLVVLTFIGIIALCFNKPSFAFGPILGMQPSQPTGDLCKNVLKPGKVSTVKNLPISSPQYVKQGGNYAR